MGLISRKLCRSLLVFLWLYFIQCLTFFSSINHLLHLCAWFLILFPLTYMRFYRSTHLLFLSLETLTSIIRTGLPILVELIDLVNSVIISLSQMTLSRFLTFLLGFQTVILIVLLFWIYLFPLKLVSVLQRLWLSIGKFWSCCCLGFNWLSVKFTTGFPISSHSLWLSLCWLGWSLWSFERCSMRGHL